MNEQKCFIKSRRRQNIPAKWKFTGRIKYIKFDNITEVSFEISYTIKDWSFDPPVWKVLLSILGITLWVRPYKTEIEWLPDHLFRFEEIPSTEIVTCH